MLSGRRAVLSAFSAHLLLTAAAARAQVFTASVTVTDANSNPLPGVQVIALTFGYGGPPSAACSQILNTNLQGLAVFSVNTASCPFQYQVLASSNGYLPSLAQQQNSPNQQGFYAGNGAGSVAIGPIQLSPAPAATYGTISMPFTNASANQLLFGGVNPDYGGQPINVGAVVTDGTGSGTLTIGDIPFAPGNTYNINLCDPVQGTCINGNVNVALSTTTPAFQTLSQNFQQFAAPPPAVSAAPGSSSGGAGSINGAMVTLNHSSIPASNLGGNFEDGYPQDNVWFNSDNNGNFNLSGLRTGATYYGQFYGGCSFGNNGPTGYCYAPSVSTNIVNNSPVPGAAPGINDFLVVSTSPVVQIQNNVGQVMTSIVVQLTPTPPSTGLIPVKVQTSQGVPLANSGLFINQDYYSWDTVASDTSCATDYNTYPNPTYQQNPGFNSQNAQADAHGIAHFTGLPSGNYDLQVFPPFGGGGTSVNFPSANQQTGQGFPQTQGGNDILCGSGTFYRITIDTTASPSLEVFDTHGVRQSYNASGVFVATNTPNSVAISTLVVTVALNANTSGVVQGTLTFPGPVDLTNNPITITLYPSCNAGGPCNNLPSGNLAVIASSGSSSYGYSINVSSGYPYFLNLQSGNWGVVQANGGGNNQIDLQASSFTVQNFQFAPAGTISGKVYQSNGTLLVPSQNSFIGIDANGQNVPSWGFSQLNTDGSYSIASLLPGTYQLQINMPSSGGATQTLPVPLPTAVVTAGKTTTEDLHLINAVLTGPTIWISSTSDPAIVVSTQGNSNAPVNGIWAFEFPAGTVFNAQLLREMLTGGNNLPGAQYLYSAPTSTGNFQSPCGPGWPGGYCAQQPDLPAPAAYDFYALRKSDLGRPGSSYYEFFDILSSSKNVVVSQANATGLVPVQFQFPPTLSSGVVVNLTPPTNQSGRGNATLTGTVTAANFFRQADYKACAGNLNNFLNFLMTVMVYDKNDQLLGGGLITPSPQWIAQNAGGGNGGPGGPLASSFATSYSSFSAVLASGAPFAYQILDLPPGQCVTAVFSSQNYPPYGTNVCLGVNGSTTTLNVNMDTAVGAGATVSGVVVSTNNVPISGAAVSLTGRGIISAEAATDSSGAFSFPGLPAGVVKVTVDAGGYALAAAEVETSGNATFTQNFSLIAAPGSMSGTVYAQKLPFPKVQQGALIYAYDDTQNGLNPGAAVPLYKTTTGSDGKYLLTGMIPGDTYRVFLDVPGEYALNVTTKATAGLVSGVDFTMLPKPIDIEIFARVAEPNFEFRLLNPSDFKTGDAWTCPTPFVSTSAAGCNEVGNLFQKQPDSSLLLDLPIASFSSTTTYDLHGYAVANDNTNVSKDVLFGLQVKANTAQSIDLALIGDDTDDGTGHLLNEAPIDKEGNDPSSVSFPAGAVLPISTAAVPAVTFSGHDPSDPSVSGPVGATQPGAIVGNVYQLSMSSVSLNPDQGVDITLAYNKSSATAAGTITVGQYNSSTNQWQQVSGVATLNPLKGTITVRLKSLASVLKYKRMGTQLESLGDIQSLGPLYSHFDGEKYVVHPLASGGTQTTGTFAVVKESILGSPYAGTSVKVFNFPNPFDLNQKTFACVDGNCASSGAGTMIHIELPAANSGDLTIRIYTIAGELVNTLSVPSAVGGNHYYVNWDGKNASGRQVANGIYYGVVTGAGLKASDTTFKMAVIKH